MPQRVVNAWIVVMGIAGLVLVVALVLFGADLRRASRTGPRWKRRLLTAALALLSAVGMGVAGHQLAEAAAANRITAGRPLADQPHWQRLTATWNEAEEVASGRRGHRPFDAKGKKALLAELADRADDVDALAQAGMLTVPERGLLKKELTRLTGGVNSKLLIGVKYPACYAPTVGYPLADASLRRVADRVGLLTKVAEAQTLHPEALRKVMTTLAADLARAEDPHYLKYLKRLKDLAAQDDPKKVESAFAKRFLSAAHHRDMAKTLRTAKALAAKIRARLAGSAGAAGQDDRRGKGRPGED